MGLGLAALGTGDPEIFEEVKSIVFQDSAVAGEGAGIGIGLLHAGTAPEFAEELLMMMRETQHEKVIPNLEDCAAAKSPIPDIASLQGLVAPAADACLGSTLAQVSHLMCTRRHRSCMLEWHRPTESMQLIRGSALGLALMMYGCEEGADVQIEDMTRDQDPILRCVSPPSHLMMQSCLK